MASWYSLWSFVIFFPFWYVWTKKNLATLCLSAAGDLVLKIDGPLATPIEQLLDIAHGLTFQSINY
jgi:uncharacterized RDD family membrane protein YckC